MSDTKTMNVNPYHVDFERDGVGFVMRVHADTPGGKRFIIKCKMDWWFWVYIVREFTTVWNSEKQSRRESETRIDASLPTAKGPTV